MGGGGAMRTAMKVASIGAANAGIRGVPGPAAVGQSVMQASRPTSAAMSSQGVKATTAEVASPVHTAASWDADGWEFADMGELVMEAGEPMPRVVFNAVPSFQEAKAATTELKEAIDQIYLSSGSASADKHEASSVGSQVSVQSFNSELETKSVESELVPKHALHAFQFLSASSEAQTVLASIVSDPNVWTAIMQNPMLNDFMQSQEKGAGSEPKKSTIKLEELPDDSDDETNRPRNGFFQGFNGFMHNIKHSVAEMLSSVSSYLHNLFGFLSPEKSGSDDADKPNSIFTDPVIMKGTFMGLAALVAMVVLFKRA